MNVRMRCSGSERLHRFLISIWHTLVVYCSWIEDRAMAESTMCTTYEALPREEVLVATRDFNVNIIEDKHPSDKKE